MEVPKATQVVIVGGGQIGLTTSILLSKQGIDHVLFERQPSTSIFPKAIAVHNRSVEVFRKMGLEEELMATSAPPETFQRCSWRTSLGPRGRLIASRGAFGYCLETGPKAEAYKNASPSRYCNMPQLRLEPILRKHAEELNPGKVLFHHDVTAVHEDDKGATVTYHRRSGDQQSDDIIRATYVIGADGGRLLTDYLGIGWKGERDILDMMQAHIRAPVSKYAQDSGTLIHWFVNPETGGSTHSGVMYHLGPYPVNPDTEEWTIIYARLPHEREKPFTKADMLKRVHQTLGIPGIEVELLGLSTWQLNAKYASRYVSSEGRIFLVGDAAHRIPPWGALGGNTGFHDADNLVWKLALALKSAEHGHDCTGLLQSYDSERRPVGERVARFGLANMRAHAGNIDKAIGISPANSIEENVKNTDIYFDMNNATEGRLKRQGVARAIDVLDIEFFALGAEAGWFYDLSSVCDNEQWRSPQVNDDGDMEPCDYRPCTMPGHQLPHAWLINAAGDRVSTRWFAKKDKFVLITSSPVWATVKHDMVEVVLLDWNEWKDQDGRWAAQKQLGSDGALLVRPDNIVAYRWQDTNLTLDLDTEVHRVVKRALWMKTDITVNGEH